MVFWVIGVFEAGPRSQVPLLRGSLPKGTRRAGHCSKTTKDREDPGGDQCESCGAPKKNPKKSELARGLMGHWHGAFRRAHVHTYTCRYRWMHSIHSEKSLVMNKKKEMCSLMCCCLGAARTLAYIICHTLPLPLACVSSYLSISLSIYTQGLF
jgi:hypothetical protein